MISFQRRSMFDSLHRMISKSYRERQDRETREAIEWLCQNPSAPCEIGGALVPNGYGTGTLYEDAPEWGR